MMNRFSNTMSHYTAESQQAERLVPEPLRPAGANLRPTDFHDDKALSNSRFAEPSSLLHAVESGNVQLAEEMLRNGAKTENRHQGRMVIHFAAESKEADEMVPLLLRYGAMPYATDLDSNNALHYLATCEKPSSTVAKLLLDLGVTLAKKNRKGFTPLHLAVISGQEKLVKVYLKHGADINAKLSDDECLLHLAALYSQDSSIVRLLIKHGADIHARTRNGSMAIHLACKRKHEAIISALLELGADINAIDNSQMTPLAVMHPKRMCPAMKVIIKHLAMLRAAKLPVEDYSLPIIQKHSALKLYHFKCTYEMTHINKTSLYKENMLSCIFSKEKLAVLSKNHNFLRAFKAFDCEHKFPIYAQDIARLLKNAETTRDRLLSQKKELYTALKEEYIRC